MFYQCFETRTIHITVWISNCFGKIRRSTFFLDKCRLELGRRGVHSQVQRCAPLPLGTTPSGLSSPSPPGGHSPGASAGGLWYPEAQVLASPSLHSLCLPYSPNYGLSLPTINTSHFSLVSLPFSFVLISALFSPCPNKELMAERHMEATLSLLVSQLCGTSS